jgi:hypothetical protein
VRRVGHSAQADVRSPWPGGVGAVTVDLRVFHPPTADERVVNEAIADALVELLRDVGAWFTARAHGT